MNGKFADNPYYVEYETLLKDLHHLIAQGQGDSEEADAVRDEMEMPERKLTGDELARLNGLSADLYMLADDEMFERYEGTQEQLREDLSRSWKERDWERLLQLLRRGSASLPVHSIAYLRAEAYWNLGQIDTALLFLVYASRKDTKNSSYKVSLMEWLNDSGRLEEALAYARDYICEPDASPLLLIQSATAMFRSTERQNQDEAGAIYTDTIRVLQRALQDSEGLLPEAASFGYLILGYCYEGLGQLQDALEAYDEALTKASDNDAALIARGTLFSASDLARAVADFQQAVGGNSQHVAPYFFLARYALKQGEYPRCLELCDKALRLTQNSRDMAVLLEWQAIAQTYLGRPASITREAFESAMTLDPLNERIKENYRIFTQNATDKTQSALQGLQWQASEDASLQGHRRSRSLPALRFAA